MKLLAIAAAVAVGIFLAAMFWPEPKPCDSVTYSGWGNSVTVTDPACKSVN